VNKLIEIWKYVTHQPSAYQMACKELENAKRHYLQAKTHEEHFAYQVQFELGRIRRLQKYVADNKPLNT